MDAMPPDIEGDLITAKLKKNFKSSSDFGEGGLWYVTGQAVNEVRSRLLGIIGIWMLASTLFRCGNTRGEGEG
jgi:hypothetical protein